MQQLILLGRERNRFALVADLLGARVEPDASVLDQHLRAPGAAPQQSPQARLEFGQVERLDQVIIRPGVEPGNAVFGGIPGRENQHRQVRTAVAQAPQHFEPVHARQAKVKQCQVKGFAEQCMQGAAAIAQPVDGITFALQGLMNPFTEGHVIFNQ
ncbi:hypothetical protein D3C76_857670 [compost metagenome]